MSAPTAPLTAFIASPGFEASLADEIGSRGPQAGEPRWPAVVTVRRPLPTPVDPVFALQQLPSAEAVRGDSLEALADGAHRVVSAAVAAAAAVALHVYVPDREPYRTIAARVAPLERALWARLRAGGTLPDDGARWSETLLLQVAMVGRTSLLVSAARPTPLPTGGFDLQPWPAGKAPVEEDRVAPSRAYGKFEEGLAWLGRAPSAGETCVDLGGSPGGWAWKALVRGARVVAVDRSPLAPPALGHARLEMVVGNAFTYRPPAPVDWLLCDVICEPARTIELVDRWMGTGLCRHVVATLKFKGQGGYAILKGARETLGRHGWSHLRFKHLHRHHNEVVILGAR